MTLRIRKKFANFINNLRDVTFDGLLWFLDVMAKFFGFYVLGEKLNVFFWIFNAIILIYVYVIGSVLYQIHYANNILAFVKNYLNILIMVMMINASYWFVTKRALLKKVIQMVRRNDERVSNRAGFRQKHDKLLKRVKYFMMGYLTVNYALDFVYQSQRVDSDKDFAIVSCPGIELKPVNKQICESILFIQECLILLIINNYHQFFLFLILHTAGMYEMLCEEIAAMTNKDESNDGYEIVRGRVHNLLNRHAKVLETINELKNLYYKPMGIDFAVNASCICLVTFVPISEYTKLIFVLLYCLIVFFIYCFLGQKLTTAAEKFARSVYLSDWVSLEVKEQKMILVMLSQAQRPVVLLAANLVPVNLYTFASTLEAIYKFVTVIKL